MRIIMRMIQIIIRMNCDENDEDYWNACDSPLLSFKLQRNFNFDLISRIIIMMIQIVE